MTYAKSSHIWRIIFLCGLVCNIFATILPQNSRGWIPSYPRVVNTFSDATTSTTTGHAVHFAQYNEMCTPLAERYAITWAEAFDPAISKASKSSGLSTESHATPINQNGTIEIVSLTNKVIDIGETFDLTFQYFAMQTDYAVLSILFVYKQQHITIDLYLIDNHKIFEYMTTNTSRYEHNNDEYSFYPYKNFIRSAGDQKQSIKITDLRQLIPKTCTAININSPLTLQKFELWGTNQTYYDAFILNRRQTIPDHNYTIIDPADHPQAKQPINAFAFSVSLEISLSNAFFAFSNATGNMTLNSSIIFRVITYTTVLEHKRSQLYVQTFEQIADITHMVQKQYFKCTNKSDYHVIKGTLRSPVYLIVDRNERSKLYYQFSAIYELYGEDQYGNIFKAQSGMRSLAEQNVDLQLIAENARIIYIAIGSILGVCTIGISLGVVRKHRKKDRCVSPEIFNTETNKCEAPKTDFFLKPQ